MLSLNEVTLLGHIGSDPEVIHLDKGRVARFSVATNRRYKDQSGQRIEETDWHNVDCWMDHICTIFSREDKSGYPVLVRGQLRTRRYKNEEGDDRYFTFVHVGGYHGQLILLPKQSKV